jgi:hypothetical protein
MVHAGGDTASLCTSEETGLREASGFCAHGSGWSSSQNKALVTSWLEGSAELLSQERPC